jgi:adenylosuccinate lyase
MIHSSVFRDQFSTPDMRAVFSNSNLIQSWIRVEVALAEAQAELGVIPVEAAAEIKAKGISGLFDIPGIEQGIAETWHPLISFIRQYTELCEGDLGQFIHWGATTQDIMDTGLVLQVRQALDLLEPQLDAIIEGLCDLATQHSSTIMAGRTHGQHALPITFGYKVAIWIAELHRHRGRLEYLREHALVGNITGAVGSLASMGSSGIEIQRRALSKLALVEPEGSWHVARDRIVDLLSFLGQLGGTFGKIANEVIQLQKTEIAELEEPFERGNVGSSTMPQKRNPMACEAVCAAALMLRNHASLGFELMVQEHERDMAVWQAEWAVLPEACLLASGIVHHMKRILGQLRVHPEKMRKNLDISSGLILAESLMMALAPTMGRQKAHDVVYDAAMTSHESATSFTSVLANDDDINGTLGEKDVSELLNPESYTGMCEEFTANIVRMARRSQGSAFGTRP